MKNATIYEVLKGSPKNFELGETGAIPDGFVKKRCNFLTNKAIESFLAASDSPSFVL